MTENEIARAVVDAAYRIHTRLGPGLLESAYHAALAYELAKRDLQFTSQQAIPLRYEGVPLGTAFHADLIVEDKVIIEIKSVISLDRVYKMQLLTYLKLAEKRLGLLINFNVSLIKSGITRVVNGLEDDYAPPQN